MGAIRGVVADNIIYGTEFKELSNRQAISTIMLTFFVIFKTPITIDLFMVTTANHNISIIYTLTLNI